MWITKVDLFISHPFGNTNNVNKTAVVHLNSDKEGKPTLHSLGTSGHFLIIKS